MRLRVRFDRNDLVDVASKLQGELATFTEP